MLGGRRQQQRQRRDAGFTLVELLIAIVIMGIITLPLGNLVISYFLNSATTQARLNESHDAQIAAQYWAQDVASIGVRGAFDSSSNSYPLGNSVNIGFSCATPAGSTTLIVLGWDEHDSTGAKTAIRVRYALDSTGTKLLRTPCGGADTLTAVLAHNVDTAVAPYCTINGDSTHQVCSLLTGAPSSITLTLHIKDPSGDGAPYDLVLTGQRRQT